MKGILKIYDSFGNVIDEDCNLIVTKGREAQADLLELQTATQWQIAIGTDNGTILPLHPSNTALGNQVAIKTVSVITRIHPTRILYQATFDSNDYGGSNVQESGLFIVIGVNKLFARRILANPISLTPPKTFTWTLFT